MGVRIVAGVLSLGMLFFVPVVGESRSRMPEAVLAQVERSMSVKGMLKVHADGRVAEVVIDEAEAYPRGVLAFVEQAVSGWVFEPFMHEGQIIAFSTPFSVRLVARHAADNGFDIQIASHYFGRRTDGDGTRVRRKQMRYPLYPREAYSRGMAGVVYLVVQVGRDGTVLDVMPEQVNLTRAGSARDMALARELLARASVQAARQWTFHVPESGALVDETSWNVRVPVNYAFEREEKRIGQWEAYIPGPREYVPFLKKNEQNLSTALPDGSGGVFMADNAGPVLKVPAES